MCVDVDADVDVNVDEIRTHEANRLEAARATISPRFVSAPSCL